MQTAKKQPGRRPRRDVGRAIALALCVVFAIVGAIPLVLGLLVRAEAVRTYAARETAKLIAEKIGVSARYEVRLQAWPMLLKLEHVTVDSSDGGPPFLEVERIAVRPRPFSLLAGKLDVGDVEILGPRVRVIVADKELKNLKIELPKSKSPPPKQESGLLPRLPMASLSVTDASVDASIEGINVSLRAVDLDVTAEDSGAVELAVHVGDGSIVRVHPIPGRDEDAIDEDVICKLDTRARIEGNVIMVRRLSLNGAADLDPENGTQPSCPRANDDAQAKDEKRELDWRVIDVSLGQVKADLSNNAAPELRGRVFARVPVPVVHRFLALAHTSGAVSIDADVAWDGKTKLPSVKGHIGLDQVGIDGKVFGKRIDLDLDVTGDAVPAKNVVLAKNIVAQWADGTVTIARATVEPFSDGVPLNAGPIAIDGLKFHALLRDLGVHPRSHVQWALDKGHFDYFRGTLNPVLLEGPLTLATKDFEIFDRPVIEPTHRHMAGVHEATIHGNFVVNGTTRSHYKFPGIILSGFNVDTPRSHVLTTVSIGFLEQLDVDVFGGSTVELADLSPLIEIPISGKLSLVASGGGGFVKPKFKGDIAIKDFVFGGFPIGDVDSAKVAFEPLVLDVMDARVRHGPSYVRAPFARFAFDKGPAVLIDADVDTRTDAGLRLKDLLEVFRLDKDPRLSDLEATAFGTARVHYALGGPEDHCGGGILGLRASAGLADAALFGERYPEGSIDMDVTWDDSAAGTAGMKADLRSLVLRKGGGSAIASATVRHGGVLRGSIAGGPFPLSKLDMLGAYAKSFDGTLSLVAELGGTMSDLTMDAQVNVSKVRIGPSSLGPSSFGLRMEAPPPGPKPRLTKCNNPIAAPFNPEEYKRDPSGGVMRVNGSLFDKQVSLDNVTITRQRAKVVAGRAQIKKLDIGTIANLIPGVAFQGAQSGELSASIDMTRVPLEALGKAEAKLTLENMQIAYEGYTIELLDKSAAIDLRGDDVLRVPGLRLKGRAPSGLTGIFIAGGRINDVTKGRTLDATVSLQPTDLAKLGADLPSIDRAGGTLDATVTIKGPIGDRKQLVFGGAAHVRKGELSLSGIPIGIQGMNMDLEIVKDSAVIKNATMKVGGGDVKVTGSVPIRGDDAGSVTAKINAKSVKVPLADGIDFTTDADLDVSYRANAKPVEGQQNLPDVKGTATLTSFKYTRPIALSLSLSQLGKTAKPTVKTYDPANDVLRFSVTVLSQRPLHFSNNLVEMDLEVVQPGVTLTGTNQRFGALGQLRVLSDSKLTLRSSEFLVREGSVRFDDPQKISPKVAIRASTEYRRYSSNAGLDAAPNASAGAVSRAAGSSWRITLDARGEIDNLKVTLTSDPTLSQEDIVLLLTLGITRAELDRGNAAQLGESVGIEALSALTGADSAIKSIVPLIDEFRFGTGYSPRTGRNEPTVTIGKRITDDVRASVTTSVGTDTRYVRSNLEWRLGRRMSVQASYDNQNVISSSPIGNIGADLRWRFEFE